MNGFPTAPMPAPAAWHHTPDDQAPAIELDEAAGYDVPEADPIDRLTEDAPTDTAADPRSAAA